MSSRKNGTTKSLKQQAGGDEEQIGSELVYTTSRPKAIGSWNWPSLSQSPVLWMLLTTVVILALITFTILCLNISLVVTEHKSQKDLEALTSLFGIQAATIMQIQSGGVALFNIQEASVVLSPIPTIQYMVLPNGVTRMAYRSRGLCDDNVTTTVLYIHDLGLSSGIWIPIMNSISPNYCVVAVDLLGHGHSDLASSVSGGSYSAQASYLRGFLVSAGILSTPNVPLYMVGDGFGGIVAMQYIATYPTDVSKVLIQTPFPLLVRPLAFNMSIGAMSIFNAQTIAAFVLSNETLYANFTAIWTLTGDTCADTAQSNSIESILFQMITTADSQAIADGWVSTTILDHRVVYQTLSIPIVMVVGANYYAQYYNAVALAEYARGLVQSLGCSLHIIGGSGRIPHITHQHLFLDIQTSLFTSTDTACDSMKARWLTV